MSDSAMYTLAFTIGGGFATACIFIGRMYANFLTRDKYEKDREAMQEKCLHAHKNVARVDESIMNITDSKLEKHVEENNQSFDNLTKQIHELSLSLTKGFETMREDYHKLKESITVLQTRNEQNKG